RIESTAAKMGRSMKKRENTFYSSQTKSARSKRRSLLLNLVRVCLSAGLLVYLRNDRHLDNFRIYFHLRSDALQSADDDLFVRLHVRANDAQSIVQASHLHASIFDFVLVIDYVEELLSLVGAQSLLGNERRSVGFTDRRAH